MHFYYFDILTLHIILMKYKVRDNRKLPLFYFRQFFHSPHHLFVPFRIYFQIIALYFKKPPCTLFYTYALHHLWFPPIRG